MATKLFRTLRRILIGPEERVGRGYIAAPWHDVYEGLRPDDVLHRGMQGEAVWNLKQFLLMAGFSRTEGAIFDLETEEEVRKFQREFKLPITGIADHDTMATLLVEVDQTSD